MLCLEGECHNINTALTNVPRSLNLGILIESKLEWRWIETRFFIEMLKKQTDLLEEAVLCDSLCCCHSGSQLRF